MSEPVSEPLPAPLPPSLPEADGAPTSAAAPVRLVFHIGAGKTGTSSIQFTLRQGQEALQARGVWYLGLMLEHAPVKHFQWQVFGGPEQFHQLADDEGSRQLMIVLDDTVRRARAAGVHTLIWSSESFFDRNAKVTGPLHRLIEQGVDVQLLAYVRRHDAWARSAYAQWALKHKTTPGPVLPFPQWVARRRPLFAPTLQSLTQRFPGRLQVRNFDAAGDTVADFMQVLGLADAGLQPVTENVTPDDTELLMRALFNDGIKEKALPMLFDRVVGRHTRFDQGPEDWLRQLMPDNAQLAAVVQDCAEDRQQLDALLLADGQSPIATEAKTFRPAQVDESRLLMALARLAVFQMRRIENLEGRLKKLEPMPEITV